MQLVIEIQKLNDTTVAVTPVIQRADPNEAESEFCRVRSVAAVSSVPVHTVLLLNEDGFQLDRKTYYHGVEE